MGLASVGVGNIGPVGHLRRVCGLRRFKIADKCQ